MTVLAKDEAGCDDFGGSLVLSHIFVALSVSTSKVYFLRQFNKVRLLLE
jgi:hypothetical protein